ncbi:YgjV family protein [Rhodobacterales bacterium]|nr:YgjV family protein [Rhodobacterales bacterium]
MSVFLLFQELPAIFAGLAAATAFAAAPLFRTRHGILLAQLVAGVCFAVHFWFLGMLDAVALIALGVAQTSAALLAIRRAALTWTGYVLATPVMLAILMAWDGPHSILGLAGTGLLVLSRMQAGVAGMRLVLLLGSFCAAAHAYLSEDWFALAASSGAVLSATAVFVVVAVAAVTSRLHNSKMARCGQSDRYRDHSRASARGSFTYRERAGNRPTGIASGVVCCGNTATLLGD